MTQQSTHHVLHRINATVMRLDRRPQGGGRGAAILPLTPLLVAVAFFLDIAAVNLSLIILHSATVICEGER